MPRVIHEPSQHNCHVELASLEDKPIGTVAECDCGQRYRLTSDQRDGPYWRTVPPDTAR